MQTRCAPDFLWLLEPFANCVASICQVLLANVLSVLGMTMGAEDARESLMFRLQGSMDDISSWGHKYIRCAQLF